MMVMGLHLADDEAGHEAVAEAAEVLVALVAGALEQCGPSHAKAKHLSGIGSRKRKMTAREVTSAQIRREQTEE